MLHVVLEQGTVHFLWGEGLVGFDSTLRQKRCLLVGLLAVIHDKLAKI